MKTQNNQMETKNLNNNQNRNVVITENITKQIITSNLRTNNNNMSYINVNKTNNNNADDKKLNIELKTQNNFQPTGIRQTERAKILNKNYNTVKNENQELIDRLNEEIFKDNSEQNMMAANKYTYNVQKNVKMDDLIKEINDDYMTKEKKKALYFRLKAGIKYIFFNFQMNNLFI
jgi:hypothetical protein